MMFKKVFLSITYVGFSLFSFAQDYSIYGNHNKPSPVYEIGEEMVFIVKLLDNDQPVVGKTLKWMRTGDDGKTMEGKGISSLEGVKIKTSIAMPGFVRIYVTAADSSGQLLMAKPDEKGKTEPVFFDGGACAAPDKLQGVPEPADFDNYWEKQRAVLASVPLKIIEMKEVPGNDNVKTFDVKLACAGKMPVSGYLTMPKNAKAKTLPAEVSFMGYGVYSAVKELRAGAGKICFSINAHGIKNGQSDAYYSNLSATTLKEYGFSAEENSNPDTTYFNGMFLRVMRALEFVKSLPEWNGKELAVTGGSQGGLQSLFAAGIDTDVTSCYAWAPWCCDIGRTELGRIVGSWHVKYDPALNYYDPVNHVRRANPNCRLFIINNLGDYICPPSGLWIAYNNFPGPKKMEIRQGCEHGFSMKNYSQFTVSSED